MIRLPEPDYRARFAIMAYGLLIFVWMSLEDNGMLTVSLLGAVLATALILYQIFERFAGQELATRFLFPALGAFIGAASPLATIFLMFFKTAWHGHEFPDYPLELMRDMLYRMPIWAIAGGLIGISLSFLWAIKQKQA